MIVYNLKLIGNFAYLYIYISIYIYIYIRNKILVSSTHGWGNNKIIFSVQKLGISELGI